MFAGFAPARWAVVAVGEGWVALLAAGDELLVEVGMAGKGYKKY